MTGKVERMSIRAWAVAGAIFWGLASSVGGARAETAGATEVPAAILFEAPLARALPDVGRALSAADLDGDGALDVAVVVPGAVAVWLNVAGTAGSPEPERALLTPLPPGTADEESASAPALADVDGDGVVDAVLSGHLAPSGCGATVLRGLGDGTFELAGTVRHPPLEGSDARSCGAIEVADFDGNGSPDIALLSAYMPPDTFNGLNGSVDVFLAAGAGAFDWAGAYELTAPGELPYLGMSMTSADLDGDGVVDLAFGSEVRWLSGPGLWRLQTLRGDGTGLFSAGPARDFTCSECDLTSIRAADYTGDGLNDVVIGTVLASGAGMYEFPVLSFVNEGEAGFGEPVEVAREIGIGGLQLQDFTGDGLADLLFTGGADRVTLLSGDGDGGFASAEQFFVSGGVAGSLAADANGDGASDLLLLDGQGQLLVAAGQLSGKRLGLPVITRPPELAANVIPTLADFDHDGILDVLSATSGRVDVLLGTGTGEFTPGARLVTQSSAWRVPLVDLNGDGALDIVTVDGDGFSTVFGTATGGFPDWSPAPGTPYREITAAAMGDVDADGDVDLVAVQYVGDVELYLNDGAAHFTLSHRFPTGTAVNDLDLADFDRDGHLDLFIGATPNCSVFVDGLCVPGQTVIWFGDGAAAFERAVSIDLRGRRILAQDVTGDGLLDLLAPEALLVGRGDGTFEPPQPLPNATALDLALADLNADGRLDLVSANEGALYVAEGDGQGGFGQNRLVSRPGYTTGLAIGNLTGSGLPDLMASRTIYLNDTYEASELIVLANTTVVGCGL
jgi:VCBS repeat protein